MNEIDNNFKMDEIMNKVTNLRSNETNVSLMRMLMTVINMISELLMNERQLRETNEFYGQILEDLNTIRRHLTQYINFEEVDSEEEYD